MKRGWLWMVAVGWASVSSAADGVWTNGASGTWSDATKWGGGVIAGDGGSALFNAAAGTFFVSNDLPGTVTLSQLVANTNVGSAAVWNLVGGTNVMVAPAVVYTRYDSLSVRGSTLAGAVDLTITGLGKFFLGDDNLYTGRTVVSNGNARVARDSGFGPVPDTLRTDAIVLNNGAVENDDNSYILNIHSNRGVTVLSGGGFFAAGYTTAGTVVNGPITGPGFLAINYENSPVTLNNSGNDYSGGTLIGTNGPGANPITSLLKLGQNEVLPDGVGKGGLRINPDAGFYTTLPTATLDLNAKTETVNTVDSGPRAAIIDSTASGGRLIVGALGGDSDYRGSLSSGATLEKQGTGMLRLTGATLSSGTVELKAGTLTAGGANLASGSSVLFNGGAMTWTAPSGLYEFYGSGGTAIDLSQTLYYSGYVRYPEKASATTTAVFPTGRQYVYRGRWWVPQDGTYSFAKSFADTGYLAIDGQMLISNAVSAAKFVTNNVALSAGWHAVELRLSNGSGTVGPQSGFRSGILYDPTNGTFSTAAQIAGAKMFTDDGGTNLTAFGNNNVLNARLLLAKDATLTIDGAAGTPVFGGIVATNQAVTPEPVLTVVNGGAPLLFGSDGSTPAVLDASVASAGGLVLTNRVWLRRVPSGAYTIAKGADVTLDGAALLGDAALSLTNYSVRVVRDDSVGGDGTVTANTGTTVWFDSMRYANQALSDASTGTVSNRNPVTLSGGTVGFTGAGTITYSGAISGTGTAVKNGAGDLLLTGTGSSFAGEIQINAGRLLPASEAALGGATVRINGGRLANPTGGSLTLAATPVIAVNGGIEATASGETVTLNGPVTGLTPISKFGNGALVLGGTAINTNFDLYVRGGTLTLAKSGVASAYAVRNLLGVQSNAVVRLSGSNGNQIGGAVVLDGGVLDLNGLSETIGVLTNTASVGSWVTNSGAQAACLTAGEGDVTSAYSARLSDGASTLAFAKTGMGILTVPALAIGYTGGTRVNGGTLRITSSLTPPTSNIVYWLDATDISKLSLSNGYVTAWSDSTTSGVNFSQSTLAQRPTYVAQSINGLPAVRFGENGRSRLYAGKSVSAQTVFIVCRMTAYHGLDGIWGQSQNDSGIRAQSLTSWQHSSNGGNNNDFSYNGQMYINGVTGTTFTAQQPHILTAVSSSAQVWTTAIGDYWGSATFTTRYFGGEIGEVLVYSSVLSDADRNAVVAYLKTKWFGGGTILASSGAAEVASGARLSLVSMKETLSNLNGAGTLQLENNSEATFADYASFTGSVVGAGSVVIKTATAKPVPFSICDIGVAVRNDSTAPTSFLLASAATNQFCGSLRDGSNTLGIAKTGTGTVYFSGTNNTYTGATRVEAGRAMIQNGCFAQYVRFWPTLMRVGGQYYTTNNYQLSEFQLALGGTQLPYPAGTTAYAPLGYGNSAETPLQAIDNNVNTKFFSTLADANGATPLIVKLPVPVFFDGYRWYTANDGPGRDPIVWNVAISSDGVNWTTVDTQNFQTNASLITSTRFALVGTWTVGTLAKMDAFSDKSATKVAAPGLLGVSGTSETIGALSGDGAVQLSAGAVLGLNAFTNAAFSGGFSGTGTVFTTGSATQTLSGTVAFTGSISVESGTLNLDGATLTGVTNITLKTGGKLIGHATVNGDLTVTFAGGTYAASLAVSGALTVNGTVTLALPDNVAYPYYQTLFTYGSAGLATQNALASAVLTSSVPAGKKATVRTTGTSARLVVASQGSILLLE